MKLGNCDYYQSFVDIANTLFCGYFPLISILFITLGSLVYALVGRLRLTVVYPYNFIYISGLKDNFHKYFHCDV